MCPEVSVPGGLDKTFSDGETACMVIEPSTFKPKMHPKKLIITTRRVIIYKPKLMGCDTRDIPLESITNIELKKGLMRSEIKIHVGSDKIEFEDVPNDDAMKAISTIKANIHSHKKVPNVIIEQQPYAPAEDSMQKLKQLKDMFDAGLISQEEYDKTKASILSRM